MRQSISHLAEYAELTALFFIQGAALGMWFVPLGTVLDAHGLNAIKPLAFGTSAIAALISPLLFGAMADRHAAPERVLRGLSLATAGSLVAVAYAIQNKWSSAAVLALIQIQALCSSPTWSISSAIVLTRLKNSTREFGAIRAAATLGWMAGCWAVSAMGADSSPVAAYGAAAAWFLLVAVSLALPNHQAPAPMEKVSLWQRFGLDALHLLKDNKFRTVFVTVTIVSIPFSAFYPFTPRNLLDLGFEHPSAWMALGQVSEVIAMFSLARLMASKQLHWVIGLGLVFGVLRFLLCATNQPLGLLAGVSLHGCSFALVFVATQIYIDQTTDPAWRARSQALLSLMTGGIGNLAGYLAMGWWFNITNPSEQGWWTAFWIGTACLAALGLGYFAFKSLKASKPKPR